MGQTKIEWTDVTVNPFPGCRRVSPGCDNCYAERMAKRLKAMGQTKYAACVDGNGWTGQVGYNPFCMDVPGAVKRVFVQSMGDLFYEAITDEERYWAFCEMAAQPQHTFQILTKRADRMQKYVQKIRDAYAECGYPSQFPPENVWMGVTAENQEWADKRIPILLQIPAAVRFVSLEPLLGAVNMARAIQSVYPTYGSMVGPGKVFHDDDEFDRKRGKPLISWVIVGCESGPKRRPCDTRWIADIVAHCHAAAVPVFVKQIQVKGKVVKDPNTISNQIGYPVDGIRQWPKTR